MKIVLEGGDSATGAGVGDIASRGDRGNLGIEVPEIGALAFAPGIPEEADGCAVEGELL